MNSNLRKLLSLALAIVMVAGILAGCGAKEPAATEAPAATEGAAAAAPEAPASTGADTSVYANDYMSEKFSPFFADTAYDQEAVGLTQISLLTSDREGNVVLQGMEGQVIPGSCKGWCLITVGGYSLGWGKGDGNCIKNHYPKGLRRNS